MSSSGYENSRRKLYYKEGESKLPKLTYNGKGSFVTKTHTVHKLRSKSSFSKKSNERDRMRGVWIQLYRGEKMIHEYKSQDVPNDLKWDDSTLVDAERSSGSSSSRSRSRSSSSSGGATPRPPAPENDR